MFVSIKETNQQVPQGVPGLAGHAGALAAGQGADEAQAQLFFVTPIVTLINLRACVEGQQLGLGKHIQEHFP